VVRSLQGECDFQFLEQACDIEYSSQVISPIFEKLAQEYYPRIKFYKVDVDEAEKAISTAARVTAMPTFIVFRKGEALEGMRGALPKQLQVSWFSIYRFRCL
jgi:thioredoxin-like negative regulator of GroEL